MVTYSYIIKVNNHCNDASDTNKKTLPKINKFTYFTFKHLGGSNINKKKLFIMN